MQRPRHPLLARAGLALDEHRRVGRRHPIEQREQLAHRHRAAEQALEVVALGQRHPHRRVEEREAQPRLPALDDRAVLERRHPHAHPAEARAVGRAEIEEHAAAARLDVDAQVTARHVLVREHQVARRVRADLERSPLGLRRLAGVRPGDHLDSEAAHLDRHRAVADAEHGGRRLVEVVHRGEFSRLVAQFIRKLLARAPGA